MEKLKHGWKETTTAAGIELSYANQKRKGFHHEEQIEKNVDVLFALHLEPVIFRFIVVFARRFPSFERLFRLSPNRKKVSSPYLRRYP